MPSTINFIPGHTSGSRNVIHDGYRYCLDKKRDDKTYWRYTVKTGSSSCHCAPRRTANLFTQLVIVHGLYHDGWRISLAFGLLPGKTQAHYKVFLDEPSTFGVTPESVLSFFVAL